MMVMQQNKAILKNYVSIRKNPDSSLGIYLTTSKVAQSRLVAKNRRLKEEKIGNIKEDSHPKVMS